MTTGPSGRCQAAARSPPGRTAVSLPLRNLRVASDDSAADCLSEYGPLGATTASKGIKPTIWGRRDGRGLEARAERLHLLVRHDGGRSFVVDEHLGVSFLELEYLDVEKIAGDNLDVKKNYVKIGDAKR
jgi:hypothetical protein